ncbi:MAG: alpha/beta hydrolase [Treponema sp.]|jgi:acetyl esterase/lipase|nr:alpha/beta hydrolase [Treponema sp.]
MERNYDPALHEMIRLKQRTVRERGVDILVKPIPDDTRPGALDRRFFAEIPFSVRKFGLALCPLVRLLLSGGSAKKAASRMRRYFNGVRSLPVASGVRVSRMTVNAGNAPVKIRIYRKEDSGGADAVGVPGSSPERPGPQARPVFYYMHGGGFAAGHLDVVEEICRQVTSRADCVGVQVDYRLAPEYPYPAALEDCYGVLRWLVQNAGSLGGDGGMICVAGDSAGGNLAAACSMRDRDEGLGAVKAQALLYPVLNPSGKEDGNFHFSLDEYDMLAEYRPAITFMITVMRSGVSSMMKVLGVDEPGPLLAPCFGKLEGLPPSFIAYGEFDYFRLESEAYARKLFAAGVPVRVIRYCGLSHAFAELIGTQPQAEDCMEEIAAFLRHVFYSRGV